MPAVELFLYRDKDGSVPIVEWLDSISQKAREKCLARLELLAEQGHELRRPLADYLRDGIYELRIGLRHQNYRLLYFFHGTDVVVVTHGLVKEKRVPPKEIELAVERKRSFEQDPDSFGYKPPSNA